MNKVSYGTLVLDGTLTSLVSLAGGSEKKCYVSATGDGISLGTVTPTVHGFGIRHGETLLLDNTNSIYAVGTASGTLSYWSQR
jgi:hypothetical protein